MKKIVIIVTVILLILIGCSGTNTVKPQGKNMPEWVKTANLDAQETPQQLYEAALYEDTLIIYSVSTRLMDVKQSFEEHYPGLTVEIQHIRANDLVALLKDNFNNKRYLCDIVLCTDNDASLSNELIPNKILYKYIPYDIKKKLLPDHNCDQLEFLGEAMQLVYNNEFYDKPPVSNWWELTEPKYKGKIYISNPLRSMTTFAMLCTFVQHSDEMAQAYRNLYGKELIIPKDSNAGKVFLQGLIENDMQVVNFSDDVAEAVGTPNQSNPPFGLMLSSKVRLNDIGYCIEPVYGIEPNNGVYVTNSIMIAGGAKNINSAKLFVRWLLGEADGTGEGYKPYLQNGTWSVRGDINSQTAISLQEANFWKFDKHYIAQNKKDIEDFWLSLQKQQ